MIRVPGESTIKQLAAFLALLVLIPSTAGAAERFQVGPWSGEARYDEAGEEFFYCAIRARYSNGYDLSFSLSTDKTFTVALASERWNLRVGQALALHMRVDYTEIGWRWADVLSARIAVVPFPEGRELIEMLSDGRTLDIETDEERLSFELLETRAALKRLEECVVEHELTAIRAPSIPESLTEDEAGESPSTEAEDVEVMKKILSMAGLEDFRYLAPSEAGGLFRDADHSWTDDYSVGAMYVIRDKDWLEVSKAVAAFFAAIENYCEGRFSFSLTASLDFKPEVPARRALGRCELDEGTILIPTFIWKERGEIGIVSHAAETRVMESATGADEKFFRFFQALYAAETLS
ncbi:MAG: hypothetical protein O7A65_12015 [Proteobacteria bacterium]|nr:hypothetical protein [Pseudomonadota bacterium]